MSGFAQEHTKEQTSTTTQPSGVGTQPTDFGSNSANIEAMNAAGTAGSSEPDYGAIVEHTTLPLERMGFEVEVKEVNGESVWYVNGWNWGNAEAYQAWAKKFLEADRSYGQGEIVGWLDAYASWVAKCYVVPPTEHITPTLGAWHKADGDPYEQDVSALPGVADRLAWIKPTAAIMGYLMTFMSVATLATPVIVSGAAVSGQASAGLGLRLLGHGLSLTELATMKITSGSLDDTQLTWFNNAVLRDRDVWHRFFNEHYATVPYQVREIVFAEFKAGLD